MTDNLNPTEQTTTADAGELTGAYIRPVSIMRLM
jgi:hypothetical protein